MPKTTCAPSVLQACLATVLALLLAPQTGSAANIITVSKTQNLDFGAFVVLPSCINCTITVPLTGARTATAGIVLMDNINPGRPAQFNVTCNNTPCAFSVLTPAGVTMSAGGVSMTVGGYVSTRTSTSTPSTITMGATLTIPSNGSLPNTYAKNFTVQTSP